MSIFDDITVSPVINDTFKDNEDEKNNFIELCNSAFTDNDIDATQANQKLGRVIIDVLVGDKTEQEYTPLSNKDLVQEIITKYNNSNSGGRRRTKKNPTARRRRSSKARKSRKSRKSSKARKARTTRRK